MHWVLLLRSVLRMLGPSRNLFFEQLAVLHSLSFHYPSLIYSFVLASWPLQALRAAMSNLSWSKTFPWSKYGCQIFWKEISKYQIFGINTGLWPRFVIKKNLEWFRCLSVGGWLTLCYNDRIEDLIEWNNSIPTNMEISLRFAKWSKRGVHVSRHKETRHLRCHQIISLQ